MQGMLSRQIAEKLQLAIAQVPAVALLGVAPKIGKHYSQTCDDVDAAHKYVLYGGDDEFPLGNEVKIISLAGLMEKLQSG
jgi:hypothetical protein